VITAQLLKKFLSAPVTVKTWNGTFKTAEVKFPHSKGGYTLCVSVPNPVLAAKGYVDSACESRPVEFVVYDTRSLNCGTVADPSTIPQDLATVIAKLRSLAEYTAAEAQGQSNTFSKIFNV
jgi:hypothetical protein